MAYACSTTKNLRDGQLLYQKSNILITDAKENRGKVSADELSEYVIPEANRKFLNIFPFRLWWYNLAGDDVPDKGFRNWLKNKVGEAPVLFKNYQLESSKSELHAALNNRGFFHHELSAEVVQKRKKAYVNYRIRLNQPFTIDTLLYPKVTDTLTQYMQGLASDALIKSGQDYNLELLKKERSRVSAILNNKGFFYISPNNIQFVADTLHSHQQQLGLSMKVSSQLPEASRQIYKIGKVTLFHDYSEEQSYAFDTLQYAGLYHVYRNTPIVKPKVLSRAVFLNTGDVYKDDNYRLTLQKLSNLNVFRYVNIRFEADTTGGEPLLNALIYLKSGLPKSVSTELQAVSKSNDYVGPGLTFSYDERNIAHSASYLQLSLNSSFETQLGKSKTGVSTLEVGTSAQLVIPKLVIPFVDGYKIIGKRYSPKTTISGGYTYWTMSDLFDFNSMDVGFGYDWQETRTKHHKIDLISLSYNHIYPKAEWDEIYDYIDESFRDQFILGLKYTFTYNDQNLESKYINTYLTASAEFAGNALALGESIFNPNNKNDSVPSKMFGAAYAQYTRLFSEIRLQHKFSDYNKIAARVAVGLGIPYGNSTAMPYNKQFFIGGASSVRAFASRSMGPGAYNPPDSLSHDAGIEHAGDLKLEANIEYRFDLYKYLKGAWFMDAGNVWLLNANSDIPGGEFKGDSFLKQMAVGTGLGLRVDASFLVLRLDVGVPLRKPYPTNGEYWLFKDMKLGSSSWRRDNLMFNIAFGYPF